MHMQCKKPSALCCMTQCLSVCHKLVFYQNGLKDPARFQYRGTEETFGLSYTVSCMQACIVSSCKPSCACRLIIINENDDDDDDVF